MGREDGSWLATAHFLALNRSIADLSEPDVVALVRETAAGRLDERDVAAALDRGVRRRTGRLGQVARFLFVANGCMTNVQMLHWRCPACGGEIVIPGFPGGWMNRPTAHERTAICAKQNRTHDRTGIPRDVTELGDPLVALSREVDRLRSLLVTQ